MAEHIDDIAMLSSGGHRWDWGQPIVHGKTLQTIATTGAAHIVTSNGPRPVTITGMLKVSGGDKATVDAAMGQLLKAIEIVRMIGKQCDWEDDAGRTGDALVVKDFNVQPGTYSPAGGGGTWTLWQSYRIEAIELKGRPGWLGDE